MVDDFSENRPLLISESPSIDAEQLEHDIRTKASRAQLERSLVKKLDFRMSILVVIYILNYIDRNNAAAARLRGFEEDLRLEGNQFASILSILYVGYTIMQIPSNMFLNYMGKPSVYLPCCMIIWGGISFLTGFVNNFFGALCARFLLGFVEAAFFPGALFLISKWYKRDELSQRMALLSCGILISNAFGSLIASVILDGMDGILGYAAWRWLFFVEGAATVFVAICAVFILPDFPETSSSWLTPAEAALAQRRMTEDIPVDVYKTPGPTVRGSDEEYQASIAGLSMALSDWKVWWLALALTSMVTSLSFNAYFPTLSATMGYSTKVTLLLCAPPWAFATVVALAVSRHSDRSGERCWHIITPLIVGILGFFLAMSTMKISLRYFSLFLMAQSYAGFICFLAWASGTISQPASKRAVALAFINSISSFGNIMGSYVWPASWGPTYYKSYVICILASGIAALMCIIFRRHLAWLNDMERQKEELRGEPKGFRYML